jgi:CRISPR-associated protein Csd2
MPKNNNNPHLNPNYRHDFIFLFDVSNGNPNGDPDAGNLPRTDPETMKGLVTDGCIKRKIRNFVDISKEGKTPYRIYIQDKGIALNDLHEEAYQASSIKATGTKQLKEDVDQTRAWMCENFYDIRMFGAVMSTGVNCGQVKGPLQITISESIDPVSINDMTITRVAITKSQDAKIQVGDDDVGRGGKNTEMGHKPMIAYGLYRGFGFFSPHSATATGATEEDLVIFWEALQRMWEIDRSASRGMMALQRIFIFSHENPLGNAASHKLFDRIGVSSKTDTPRKFADYEIMVSEKSLPEGVTLTILGD